MKRIMMSLVRKKRFWFISKIFLTGLIFNIAFIRVTAQNTYPDFNAINWTTAAPQQYSVSEAQGEVVHGKLYSFGGFDSRKSPAFTPTKRAYVYDPANDTWSAIADLPYTPNGADYGGVTHAGITTDSTDIYIAGGYTSNTAGTGQIFGTKQVWKYIISQNVYTQLPDLPVTIAAGQLEFLDGKLHYIAGTNSSRTLDLGTHYVLDLNNLSNGWATLAPLPNPRQHAASTVYKGKIYFIGGQHGHDAELVTQKDVHVYDPVNDTWTKMADLPVPAGENGRGHISSAAAVIGDRILVLGGEIVHKTSVNMVSAYSPAANSWENLTPLPQSRFSGVAGVIDSIIYYTGGSGTRTTYKGTPELVVLSSQNPAAVSEQDAFDSERNFKKPIVYPNPVQKQFKIRFPSTYRGHFNLTIADRAGRIYNLGKIRIQTQNSDINIDISRFSLPPGVYFLKIISETKNDQIKLIIQ